MDRAASALVLTAILAVSASAQDSARITGRVTDSAGAPIAFAAVYIRGTDLGAMTDSSGRYEMSVPVESATSRRVAIWARGVGYLFVSDSITLDAGHLVHDFRLRPVPLPPPRRSRSDSLRLARGEHLPACLPEDGEWPLLETLRRQVSAPAERDNRILSGLPAMDSATAEREVVQIESGPLCGLAVRAFDARRRDIDPSVRQQERRVGLYQVGDRYVVFDPSVQSGEFMLSMTFDRSWRFVAAVLR